jgi:glucosyl-dolichyl phosphate glucuronosyltransferase
MQKIDLTVLLATRNGERVLPRTLEGYCRLERVTTAWKLVIVDNGSDDSTPAVLESFKERLPLETLTQPKPGKNRALNYGLGTLEGQLAIITDDDAIPDPSFINAWGRYLVAKQDHGLFGGSVGAFFEVPPPKWLLESKASFEMLFATRDLPEGPIDAGLIFGPNMAVRRSIFDAGFRFNENIGPNGSDPNYPMGSETEFCRRVERSGVQAWFARGPRVEHIVRESQLNGSYWAKRFYRHGRGTAQQMWESGQSPPSYLWRPFAEEQVWLLYHRLRMLSPFPALRFNSIFAYQWKRGFLDEWNKKQAAAGTGVSNEQG